MMNEKDSTEKELMDQSADLPIDSENQSEQEVSTTEEEIQRDYESELKEMSDKYLRLFAEFENYKKRTSKERIELFKTAGKEVILSLLPVMDDFDRALKQLESLPDTDPTKEGILLIRNKFFTILSQKGVKEIESVGVEFNTDFHEAITQIPAPTEEQKNKIIDVMEKGYLLNDAVIRFAKVIVGI